MKKNTLTKIMAIIALFGIILGVVSSGIMIFYETLHQKETSNKITKEEKLDLSNFLKNLTGSVNNMTGATNTTGSTNNTGIIK